jgi:hypothetical protein
MVDLTEGRMKMLEKTKSWIELILDYSTLRSAKIIR